MTADGAVTVLHTFLYPVATEPTGGLTLGADGEFYGTTTSGGSVLNGTVTGDYGTVYRTTFHDPPPAPPVDPDPPVAPVPTLPTVTVEATVPQVALGSGGKAVLTLRLSEPQATDTTVRYVVKGSAVNGTDYVLLKGTAKIKAGRTSKAVKIVPQGNLDGAGKRIVKFTLAVDPAYTVGTTDALKVKLLAAP